MNDTLGSWTLDELRQRTASADPTPGGGSVAAICAALGCSLLIMAIEVTAKSAGGSRTDLDLAETRSSLEALADSMAGAADEDVAVFASFMAAYQLPRTDDAQQQARRVAIAQAAAQAAEVPLRLAEDCAAALRLVPRLEAAVVPGITSDVLAGRDLLIGAARAALHTVTINLPSVADQHREALHARHASVHALMIGDPGAGDLSASESEDRA